MNDLMLYVMVASIFCLFGWAGFEYAKAGYQFWKEQHQTTIASKASGNTTSKATDHQTPEERARIAEGPITEGPITATSETIKG